MKDAENNLGYIHAERGTVMKGSNQFMKKLLTGVFCLLAGLLLLLAPCEKVQAAEDVTQVEHKTVKVGYNPIEGYFMQSEDGIKSGYGYDITQKMLVYENWQYDYVGYEENYSQNDMFYLLESGQIDLLVYALKSDDRMGQFRFSNLPVGYIADRIIAKTGNNKFSVNNFEKWDGIKVGFLTDSNEGEAFSEYAKYNGFSYQEVGFETREDLESAIQQDEIDIAVAPNFATFENVWILDQFDEIPVYAAVNKDNSELLTEVNSTLSKIESDDAEFREELYRKYYAADMGSAIPYTQEEADFVEQSAKEGKVYKALINPDRKPLSYYEEGEMKGLLTDICQTIFERSGLTVEFIIVQNRDEYVAELDQADIICDFTGGYGKAELSGFVRTDTYYNSATSMLRRKDYDGTGNRCAIVGSTISGWLRDNLDAEFLSYDSVEDCIQAVIDGDADFLYSYTRCVQDWVYSDVTNSLVVVADNHQNTDFSIAVKGSENTNLSSILVKSIGTITKEDISQISDSYTYYENSSPTLLAMIYAQPVFFVLVIIFIVIFFFGLGLLLLGLRQRKHDKIRNEELSEALEDAKKANQARTDFFARISHDMRTPMNSILGLVHLSEDETDVKILTQNMNKIRESGMYLLGLINDTLDYQKFDLGHIQLHPEVISIRKLIHSCTDMVTENAEEKGITFRIINKNADFDGYVLVDVMYIRKILLNLLSNAFKFTEAGGTVELEMEELGRKGNIVHERITVRDTGSGMSQDFLENGIFKPFSQESNMITPLHEGTGLGLSIVKQLTKLMGAELSVESKLEEGTTFTIEIDFETVEREKAENVENTEQTGKSMAISQIKGKSILLVEDHSLNAQIVTKLLEKAGCKVTWAKDGSVAVELFEMSELFQYDIVLMD
ncbi:MAG: transporter substrate-binding domain-containing protein [Hespellia sp.]|nr:transporter substrate-binding domain-containing protein [Hespellia sp.]